MLSMRSEVFGRQARERVDAVKVVLRAYKHLACEGNALLCNQLDSVFEQFLFN